MFFKKAVVKFSQNSQERTSNGVLHLVNSLEIGLYCRYFLVNFARFFKINNHRDHSLITYAKFSEKHKISYPLIRTHSCAYQRVRNDSFLEDFAYVLNR